MKYFLSVLALSLAACSPSAEQPPANQVESPAPEEKKPVPSLEGEPFRLDLE